MTDSISNVLGAFDSFSTDDVRSIQRLQSAMESESVVLATSLNERIALGKEQRGGTNLGLWNRLESVWQFAASRLCGHERTITEINNGTGCSGSGGGEEDADLGFLLVLARFTRNLVAQVSHNQLQAYRCEPQIRQCVHYLTSWIMLQRQDILPLTRMLVQTLSNMITGNPELCTSLWTVYMADAEDSNILLRLLVMDDVKTLVACLVLMLNTTTAKNEPNRVLFVESRAGQRVAIKLLTKMESLFDAPGDSPGANAYDIGYQFLRQLFDQGLGVILYNSLEHEDPVMPHQRTLLKLLDGYLQALSTSLSIHPAYAVSMPSLYTSLVFKTHGSIKASLSASPDPHLPALSEAVVLSAQCCQAMLLRESESGGGPTYQAMERETMNGTGCIELTIETLRDLNTFLPRIEMGKAIPILQSKTRPVQEPTEADPSEFPYLKRDLIRVLGTLAYRNRAVQDRIRQCGGVQVVMGHCVIDERNPYLREHAVFTLRNLLEQNVENQGVVREMKPLRGFDADGILRDIAES